MRKQTALAILCILLVVFFAFEQLTRAQVKPSTADSIFSRTLDPVTNFYATQEASGKWRVVGEVVFKNINGNTLTVQGLTLDLFSTTGMIGRRNYKNTEFRNMLFVVTRTANGEAIFKPRGTTSVAPNDEVIALVTNANLTNKKPESTKVTMLFGGAPSTSVRVPVLTLDESPQFYPPFAFQKNRSWIAVNTAGTYSHWLALYPESASGYFISQRYAIDFVQVNEQLETSSPPNSAHKEDYFAWNRTVKNAADGKVVAVLNDRSDLEIGQRDSTNPGGNFVVVQHAPNIFTFYAHLRQGSVQVRTGNVIKRGRMLGKVGNSGNTSQPHLHFHVMDRWENQDPVQSLYRSQGLPMLFWNGIVSREGKRLPINGRCLAEFDVILPPTPSNLSH